MAIPEWLPVKGDEKEDYTLCLANGVSDMLKQEVWIGFAHMRMDEG